MSPQMFDAYRVNKYNPDLPILQWNAKSTELVSWTKNLRFSSKDYPKFNDEAYFQKYLEKFLTALQSHGMQDVIDATVNYTDPTLFHAHSMWLYKLWQDTWLASGAKVLLAQHLQDKDVRTIWKEFNDLYGKSMATELRIQQHITYISSARLDDNWRGNSQNFIWHFQEQVRHHAELSGEPFSDSQNTNFLNQAVNKVPHLSHVLTLTNSAMKAAGRTSSLTFSEYCEKLLAAAQVFDAQSGTSKSRTRRSVNTMDITFDDDADHVPQETYSHDTSPAVFDTDTDIETILQAYQADSKRPARPARMDKQTWNSLPDNAKKAWDMIADEHKQKILGYAVRRASGNRDHRTKRSANTHDTSDTNESSKSASETPTESSGTKLEVGTHELYQHDSKVESSLLGMATNPTKTKVTQSEAHVRELLAKHTTSSQITCCLLYTSPSPRD